MTTTSDLREQLRSVPARPGAYVFKDARGNVLYVGKAKSLRGRMASYFRAAKGEHPKIALLRERIDSFEVHLTDNEVEALILEANLIKRFRPPYNVDYRDDKSYPYVAVSVNEEHPRVYVTREKRRKGVRYYGPYTNVKAVRAAIKDMRRIFPVRQCRGSRPGRVNGSPCLNFHIDRCLAPCIGEVSPEEYGRMIGRVCEFLEGRRSSVLRGLRSEMKRAAARHDYEQAASIRNRLQAAERSLEKQKMVLRREVDADVVAVAEDVDLAVATVFIVREGKLIASENFAIRTGGEELLPAFLRQYYQSGTGLPHEVLLPEPVEDATVMGDWLSVRRREMWAGAGRVRLRVPARGEKRRLVELAADNARQALKFEKGRRVQESEALARGLAELTTALGLARPPSRIECFDVSTVQGRASVGSMVVFAEGRPERSAYRRFRVRSVEGQNDFAMMREIVTRRLKQAGVSDSRFGPLPDLLLVDGGKPQLSAALEALRAAGPAAGADGPVPEDGSSRSAGEPFVAALAKREEQLFVSGRRDPIELAPCSEGLYLVKRIRDEAHRFAISYHRDLRGSQMVESVFDRIEGVGPDRKRKLLRRFGSAAAVESAGLDELAEVVPRKVAKRIHETFHAGV